MYGAGTLIKRYCIPCLICVLVYSRISYKYQVYPPLDFDIFNNEVLENVMFLHHSHFQQ